MVNWKKEISRFGNDEYAAKYLTGVYNPEFKIHVPQPKNTPELSNTGIMFSWSTHQFKEDEQVF